MEALQREVIAQRLTQNHKRRMTPSESPYEVLAEAAEIASQATGANIQHTLLSESAIPDLAEVVKLAERSQRDRPTIETAAMLNYYQQQIDLSRAFYAQRRMVAGTTDRVVWTAARSPE